MLSAGLDPHAFKREAGNSDGHRCFSEAGRGGPTAVPFKRRTSSSVHRRRIASKLSSACQSRTESLLLLSLYCWDDTSSIVISRNTSSSSPPHAFPSDLCVLGIQFLIESEGFSPEKLIRVASPPRKSALVQLLRRKTTPRESVVQGDEQTSPEAQG